MRIEPDTIENAARDLYIRALKILPDDVKRGFEMLAMTQVMRHIGVAQPLHLQRDPHPIGGGGAIVVMQNEVAHRIRASAGR